jgi:glycolate oxidase FAD binding subunit
MNELYRIDRCDQLIELIRAAGDRATPIYPQGGGTRADFGLPIRRPGWQVDLTGLSQVVDYPAADMTITVQAGIRMADLQQTLAAHQQQLPLDIPRASEATLGGVLAVNSSGPRRFGYGTARDYVIGIRAVDGHATPFAGGGRVVKNVAGYDFCKLLIGSLGTLGVITDVTLKLRPVAPARAAIVAAPRDGAQLSEMLADLVRSATVPSAIEWLAGPAWQCYGAQQGWPTAAATVGWLALLLEGQADEVSWMQQQLAREWSGQPGLMTLSLISEQTSSLLEELTEFPVGGDEPTVLQASLRPSGLPEFIASIQAVSPGASIQAHAGTGIVRFRLPDDPAEGLGRVLTGRWQPLAARNGGNIIILANRGQQQLSRRTVWGSTSGPWELMQRIKRQFDPHNILNPDRFVY